MSIGVRCHLLDIGYLRGNLYENRCLCGCVWELVCVFMSGLLDVLFVCMTTCVWGDSSFPGSRHFYWIIFCSKVEIGDGF